LLIYRCSLFLKPKTIQFVQKSKWIFVGESHRPWRIRKDTFSSFKIGNICSTNLWFFLWVLTFFASKGDQPSSGPEKLEKTSFLGCAPFQNVPLRATMLVFGLFSLQLPPFSPLYLPASALFCRSQVSDSLFVVHHHVHLQWGGSLLRDCLVNGATRGYFMFGPCFESYNAAN
jgi:hypothetical protein